MSLSRRSFVKIVSGLFAYNYLNLNQLVAKESSENLPEDEFSKLFRSVIDNPSRVLIKNFPREGAVVDFDTKKLTKRVPLSKEKISADAEKMIITMEIGNQNLYEKKYQGPVWPGGDSGVTIGFGYDLGYTTKEWIDEDWQEFLAKEQIDKLAVACQKKGVEAKNIIKNVNSVSIDWTSGLNQFQKYVLPRYIGETISVLPNTDKLSADCLGALVSLVYNRGSSFNSDKPSRREMKRIYIAMEEQDYKSIPTHIRDMKKIWENKGLDGLLVRRELEASLFERGLRS